MNREKLKSLLLVLIKVFFIGLLVQFFVQTFITFELGWDGKFWNLIWMWKEVILIVFLGIIIYSVIAKNQRNIGQNNKIQISSFGSGLSKGGLLWLITALITFVLAIVIQKVGISTYIMTVKYDLLPFFILGLGICLGLLYFNEKDYDIIKFYHKICKFVLWGGLFRRLLVYLMPNALKFFGYDPYNWEGTVGAAPPAAYYTGITPNFPGSVVRNQFLFERPISLGFWLIAFFPVFALGFLRKKSIKKQIGYTIGFGLLVLSTRSRAAIVMFALEVVVLILILHWKNIKRHIPLFIALLIVGIASLGFVGTKYFAREHSTTGHLVLLQEGLNLAKEHLIIGRGAGYAGPASHQICYNALENDLNNSRCDRIKSINDKHEISTYGFNPENQFLQILIEYGVLGLIPWLLMIFWILLYSRKILRLVKPKNESERLIWFSVLGFGIGLIGLCGEGMLLHSFSDRMVVYPFFLLYGLSIGLLKKIT